MRKEQAQGTCDILLVDNKKVSRDMVQRLLEHAGYQVVTAEHGQEAISILSQRGFTCRLVITETVMPYVNGFDLIRFIKSGSAIPVMVLSAAGDERTVSEIFRLRADDFLKKPFMNAELLQRVQQVLAFSIPAASPELSRTNDLSDAIRGRRSAVLGKAPVVPIRLAS